MKGDCFHERWLREQFHHQLRAGTDPKILARYLDDLLEHRQQQKLVDFLFQHSWDATTVYEAYALGVMQNWYTGGLISFVSVRVGTGPVSDRLVKENNRRLGSLPAGFEAQFAPGIGNGNLDDGHLAWSFDICLENIVDGRHGHHVQPVGRAPLEVGTTKASRTLQHLLVDGALARWPYNAIDILLCVVTPAGREAFGCIGVVSRGGLGIPAPAGIRRVDERDPTGADACEDLGLTARGAA